MVWSRLRHDVPFSVGLTQNRPSGVALPCRTGVLPAAARLAGTILRKSYSDSVTEQIMSKPWQQGAGQRFRWQMQLILWLLFSLLAGQNAGGRANVKASTE